MSATPPIPSELLSSPLVALKGDSMAQLNTDTIGNTILRSKETVNNLWSSFNQFDTNRDGRISFSELHAVLSKIRANISDEEIHATLGEIDMDGDGGIDFKEFVNLMAVQFKKIRQIGEKLLEKSDTIRDIFRRLDPDLYGYLTTEQFRTALDEEEFEVLGLTQRDKDLIVAYCDVNEIADRRITYPEFYRTFFRWKKQELLEAQGHGHLKQVFIVTRHGTRFPLTPMPNNAAWPNSPAFWKTYGGKLTPKGIKEHSELGERLAQWYQDRLCLIPDDPNFPNQLHVYTTNTDRTLFSASGLLSGFAPTVPQAYAVAGDEDDLHYQGIRIHIADPTRKHVPVLHGYTENPKYAALKKKSLEEEPYLVECSKDPVVEKLFDKMWTMTEHDRIDPKKSLLNRLSHMSPVYQQIEIERSMRMNVLKSNTGLDLTVADEKLLAKIADAGKLTKFQGNNDEDFHTMARAASGLLPHTVVESFATRIANIKDPVNNTRDKRFVLYSGHDYTIMALLVQLGFRNFAIPKFASHVIFELYQTPGTTGMSDDDYYVQIQYNDNPAHRVDQEEYFHLKLSEKAPVEFSERETGKMPYSEFKRILMEVRRSFTSEEEWQADAHSEDDKKTE
eukprot:TRINITY_DN4394_c0_g1_i1.p1 TRINITY_DN4394_c0_g1~~TRINITY_DN4394_c0_g1_i1.p1  ORF type:complete len:648 (+),score=136.69 TRINITY_DN4394_c0_g1_i1:88-1944(+)